MFRNKTHLLICALILILAGSAPAYSQNDEFQVTQLFIRGLTAMYNTDFEGAISLFEDAATLRPNDGAILAALSEAFAANGDVSAALFYAEAAAAALPDEPSVHRQLADLYLGTGDREAAIESLRRVVALSPRDSESLRILARAQYQSGMLEDALVSYERLLDFLGESPAIRLRLYQIYRQTENYPQAAETLQVLIDLNPEEPTIRQELVNLWITLGETERAVDELKELLALAPDNEEARLLLAELHSTQGDPNAATSVLEGSPGNNRATDYSRLATAYTENPDDPSIVSSTRDGLEAMLEEDTLPPNGYILLGEIRLFQGDFESAAEILTKGLALINPHTYPYELLAEAHFRNDDHAATLDVVEEGLLLFPGHIPYLFIGANAHIALENNQPALEYILLGLEILEEDSPDAVGLQSNFWGIAGLLYSRMEQTAKSDEAHETALRLNPDNVFVLNNFAWFLAERGDRLDEALEMATTATEMNPGNPSFIDTLGWVHHKRGSQSQAIQYLRQAADLAEAQGMSPAEHFEHLGHVYRAEGNYAEARSAWQRALDLEPDRQHLEDQIRSLP